MGNCLYAREWPESPLPSDRVGLSHSCFVVFKGSCAVLVISARATACGHQSIGHKDVSPGGCVLGAHLVLNRSNSVGNRFRVFPSVPDERQQTHYSQPNHNFKYELKHKGERTQYRARFNLLINLDLYASVLTHLLQGLLYAEQFVGR